MRRSLNDAGVAGAFEELPALLVVLVAVSLFTVSVAHAVSSGDDARDRARLQDDCLAFASMVRCSEVLGGSGCSGEFDMARLANASAVDFAEEFNSTMLGFGYRVVVNCVDLETGNTTLTVELGAAAIPDGGNVATSHTCVNVLDAGTVGAARVSVSIWRLA